MKPRCDILVFGLILLAAVGSCGGEPVQGGVTPCVSLTFGDACAEGGTQGHCFLRVANGPLTDLACYPDSIGGACDRTRCGLPCTGGVCLAVGGDTIPEEPSCVDLRVLRHGDLLGSCGVVMGFPCLPGDTCDTGTCYPSEPGYGSCAATGATQAGAPCTKWNDCAPGAVCLFDDASGGYLMPCDEDYACVGEDIKCVHCNSAAPASGKCYQVCGDTCDIGVCQESGFDYRICPGAGR